MLIIRSRGAAQELRRLTSDVQRVIGWSNSDRYREEYARIAGRGGSPEPPWRM